MEAETYQPRVMYAPDGKTRRTDTLHLETALKQQGWEFTPFPEPPEPAKPMTIQELINDLGLDLYTIQPGTGLLFPDPLGILQDSHSLNLP